MFYNAIWTQYVHCTYIWYNYIIKNTRNKVWPKFVALKTTVYECLPQHWRKHTAAQMGNHSWHSPVCLGLVPAEWVLVSNVCPHTHTWPMGKNVCGPFPVLLCVCLCECRCLHENESEAKCEYECESVSAAVWWCACGCQILLQRICGKWAGDGDDDGSFSIILLSWTPKFYLKNHL